MPTHLFDATSWSAHDNSNPTLSYEIGNRFGCTADLSVTGLRWYRRVTTAGDKPAALRLWRASDSALIATISPAPDNGAVGWQDSELPAPIPLTIGTTYVVAMDWPGGHPWATKDRSTIAVPPSPALWDDNARAFHEGAFTYPSTIDNANAWAVDITWDGPTGGPLGGGGTTSTADLAAWLSNDGAVNTHQEDGTPWETNQLATGASGFAAIKGVVDTIATSVGGGLGAAVSALTTALATANAALVHAATTWSDALATALQNMSDGFASFGASKPAQGGGDFGTGTFPSDVGTLVWTLLDETDFVGSIAWAQPADVYVLSITALPIGLPLNLTDGVHTIYRCGWWTPLNGSFARQRSYIDFEDSHLAIGAERMPGVLVSLQPGGEGHIQAWALT